MNSVIIISNDPRIVSVKDAIQPLLLAKIGIVPDFDTGLKEVFEKRPLVVFIQDKIAGVKGETVTRHIKSLLQANSPQFINLDLAAEPGMSRDSRHGINLNLPDVELIAVFIKHLEAISSIRWKEALAKPEEPGPPIRSQPTGFHPEETLAGDQQREQAAEEEDEVFSFITHYEDESLHFPAVDTFSFDSDEAPAPPSVLTEPVAASATPVTLHSETIVPKFSPLSAGAPPSPPVPTPLSSAPVDSLQEPSAPLPARAPEPPVRHPDPASDAAWLNGADFEEFPFSVESAPARRSKMWIFILGGILLVALVCGGVFYPWSPTDPKPQRSTATLKQPVPVSTSAAPAKPAPAGAMLRKDFPSFIPKEGLDPTYGAVRQGWERYVSPRREYLIFRENSVIRAIQVIALQKDAIDAPFISAALRELCGDTTCEIKSRSSRDGYLIEQGETLTKAEVIFYKKKGTGETRGVVISLP